jgi:magnesium chelatase subunit D
VIAAVPLRMDGRVAAEAAGGPADAECAALAAEIFAVDPHGLGGVLLRGPAVAAEAWIATVAPLMAEGVPVLRLPSGITDDRLVGGLDLAATLAAGRPVVEKGLLARADGGVVVVPSAERLPARVVAQVVGTADTGEVRVEREGVSRRCPARFALIAVDESEADDAGVGEALRDRLALQVPLPTSRLVVPAPGATDRCAAARARLASTRVPDEILEMLCGAAAMLGVRSARAALGAVRAAAAHAALEDRAHAREDDAAAAVRLVLVPRALADGLPPPDLPDEADAEPPSPADEPRAPEDDAETESRGEPRPLDDRILAAAAALLPPGLLERLRTVPRAGAASGASGAQQRDPGRGRRIGTRMGDPRRARLDVLATLRAAAPWQPLRGASGQPSGQPSGRLRIRADDFRVRVHQRRTGTTVVFCVDASGSQALHRLAEAKGAVEMLLAESYSRRDRVALVAFRGTGAQTLLPPTRSLVRARRVLGGLPGGGATPLAAGLDAALRLSLDLRRSGSAPLVVLLTDGRANVGRDGATGRAAAENDAREAARAVRRAAVASLLIDTAVRPSPQAARLAEEMGAEYLALPVADAAHVGAAVRSARGQLRPVTGRAP